MRGVSRGQSMDRGRRYIRPIISKLLVEHLVPHIVDRRLLADRVLAGRQMVIEQVGIIGMVRRVARRSILQLLVPPLLLAYALLTNKNHHTHNNTTQPLVHYRSDGGTLDIVELRQRLV